jgi:DNA-binding HxlR family transcriptional regulator
MYVESAIQDGELLRTSKYGTYREGSMPKVISIRDRALQSKDAIDLLSNKWRITIIHILQEGALRTNEIQTAVTEVSPKVLTQTLRGMERDGLVHREIFNVVPPRVEYELTNMGRSLIKPLVDLCHWAKSHIAERDQARIRFDLALKIEKEPPSRKRAAKR